ncbi:MAG TPA: alpha/beta hydrolase [Blastocatellia bacterium]|nr:alpha/beta hydrolase [Blastocatellia bacterium]
MKKSTALFSLLIMLLCASSGLAQAPAPTATAPSDRSAVGNWEGSLDVGGQKLRLIVKITKASDDSLKATLDSPDQGAMNMPVSSVTQTGDSIKVELKNIGGVYEGTFNKEWTEISGQWKQGGASLPLVLKKTDKVVTLNRPQEPKRPFPYIEEEVAYENKAGGVKLAGTLTLPRTDKPVPAVILITGSGPQDRDEALLGHKPFLVLSDHLTRKGIAVLRVDDRGVGGSSGRVSTSTSEDFAGDVLAGVDFLKTRKEIDPKKIGLVGHSEGGLVAPMVAARSKDVAFIVMMAGPGLIGQEILQLQSALISRAGGADDAALARGRAILDIVFRALREEKDDELVKKRIKQEYGSYVEKLDEEQKKLVMAESANVEAQLNTMVNPWFRYFLTYDPKPALEKVKVPVLAINGEKDLQVPPDENLKAIELALKAGGNKDHTIVKLPSLNHLFQTSQTGSPAEYLKIEETIAPVALDTISSWILKKTADR